MNTLTKKFLENYIKFENAVKDTLLSSVLEYENSIEDNETHQKVKMCRITRNYIQHNGPDFIVPTKEMTSFLIEQVDKMNKILQTAGDVMKRIAPLKLSDKVVDAAKRLSRSALIPVVDSKGVYLGCVSDATIRTMCAQGSASKTLKTAKLVKVKTCEKDKPAKDINEPVVVVNNGKYLGIVI